MGTDLKFKVNDYIFAKTKDIQYGIYKIIKINYDITYKEYEYATQPIIKFIGPETRHFYATSIFEEFSEKIDNSNIITWKLLYG